MSEETSVYSPPCGHRHGKYRCTDTWCGYGIVGYGIEEPTVDDPHGERMAALVDVVDLLTRGQPWTTRAAVCRAMRLRVEDLVVGPWADAWRDCKAVGSIEAQTSLGVRVT